MGVYISNYLQRLDTLAHILFYPQKPLVRCSQRVPSIAEYPQGSLQSARRATHCLRVLRRY